MHLRYIALAVIALAVIAFIVVAIARRRGGGLGKLPPGAAERYQASWQLIQARFVDEPQQAVAEADRLAVEILSARGAEGRVPERLSRARKAASASASADESSRTEGLRRAMLEYRGLMDELIGRQKSDSTRREVAS